MKVAIGNRELEWNSPELGELRDSNDILDNVDALQHRMAVDGYLLIRGLHQRETVLTARRFIFDFMNEQAQVIKPGTDSIEGHINPGTRPPNVMGRQKVTHQPPVRAVLEGQPIFSFFERFFGEPALTFDYKWMRAIGKGGYTGSHYDVVYMGRGSSRLHTVWTPLGDIPIEHGTLCLCAGSHSLPAFEKVRQTYGKMDVDRDRVDGWFEGDPVKILEKFGGRWLTTNFNAGDVLIFGMYTMHCSTNNLWDRWRLSCDTRFQPAADSIDERWMGENPIAHYAWQTEPEKMKKMEAARAEWGV